MGPAVASTPYDNPPRLPDGDAVDLNTVLPGDAPLELEIGPGRGSFILERAAATSHRVLGLEIRRKWACIVDGRLAERGLGARARVLCEDARVALPRLVPDACLARAFIHFPDPWWKKRHRKRLVIVDPVVDELARLIAPGGELFVQTDVPERAEAYETRIASHPAFDPAGAPPGSARVAATPYPTSKSNREKHADRDGLPVFRMLFRRRSLGDGDGHA